MPFAVYADLECILDPTDDECKICQKHIPHSAAYYLHCTFDDSVSKFNIHLGHDCVTWFVNELSNVAKLVDEYLRKIVPMDPLTPSQKADYRNAKRCHICKRYFTPTDVKPRDHCHFTGKYRSAAHQGCNLNYKDFYHVLIVFHNMSGYESHFLIKDIAKQFEDSLKLLPINKEKYISFTQEVKGTKVNLRFIDSFRFMASSLEKLASYLNDDDEAITRKHCNNVGEFELLTRKVVFPYKYIDNWDKLEEEELQDKKNFYSKLNKQKISTEDYAHAKKVWDTFIGRHF